MDSSIKIGKTGVFEAELPGIHLTAQNSFLFIGNDSAAREEYTAAFCNSLFAEQYEDAKTSLIESPIAPELIVIDMPLNHVELVAFKVWLGSSEFKNIPVIYNEAALKATEIKQLYSQKLVDDVVNLRSNYRRLPYKAKFIQKIKGSFRTVKALSRGQLKDNGCSRVSYLQKTVDIVLSSIAILFCLPLFVLIAIAIKLESRGPIFYSAERAGKGFRVFKFFKFRTMVVDADKKIKELADLNIYQSTEKVPAFFKIQNDPRVTRVGSFLRNTSLDELPQLFNVLKGDMSIVGNRPLPLYEASTLTTDEWAERFMAPAGITGLWQVSKRGKEDMSTEERILLDINYARHRSLRGDLKIMLQTPTALLQKTNV
ncbi:MAG: hypothetical protein JWQ27_2836 [Ferruginibacter sp.]|nr:hypothetical protein [Ferruginibacter sp.]